MIVTIRIKVIDVCTSSVNKMHFKFDLLLSTLDGCILVLCRLEIVTKVWSRCISAMLLYSPEMRHFRTCSEEKYKIKRTIQLEQSCSWHLLDRNRCQMSMVQVSIVRKCRTVEFVHHERIPNFDNVNDFHDRTSSAVRFSWTHCTRSTTSSDRREWIQI